MNEPQCLRASLSIYPNMNRFVLDWLAGNPEATKFLPRAAPAPAPKGQRDAGTTSALIESNRQWGLNVEPQVRAWASGETTTLVAGQQVGFAGGPMYTLSKIASLVKMKRDIERTGRPATVFFWLATEDHDYDEVAQLTLPVSMVRKEVDAQLDLIYLGAARAHQSHVVVGNQSVPEIIITELLELLDIPRPSWLRPGVTFRDSFAELVASVFGNEVVLVDSLLPELRRAGASLFDNIRSKWEDMHRIVATRSRELQAAGYGAQVEQRDDDRYTLLFEIDAGGTRRALEEPKAIPPERTSTSALTRPLLQDAVLQPDVFIGGPAEVAYYAQVAPLHELLGVRMPRVALRGHVLAAPKRVVRFATRFGIRPEEIFTSPDALLARREPEAVAEVKREAEAGQKQLMRHIEKIGEIALPAEHALARAVNRSIGHIEYHFNKLTERAIKGLVRKDRERFAAVKELLATLYPDKQVQDRIVGWFPFWCRYEQHLVDRVIEEIEPDADTFKVIAL